MQNKAKKGGPYGAQSKNRNVEPINFPLWPCRSFAQRIKGSRRGFALSPFVLAFAPLCRCPIFHVLRFFPFFRLYFLAAVVVLAGCSGKLAKVINAKVVAVVGDGGGGGDRTTNLPAPA